MSRIITTLLSTALLLACATTAHAQCTKDTDCKGDRICSNGQCLAPGGEVAPAPAPVPAPAQPPPPPPPAGYGQQPPPPPPPAGNQPAPGAQPEAPPEPELPLTWPTFYGSFGIPITFHGWGSVSADGFSDSDLEAYALGGIHIAGYYAMGMFHIGGYFSFQAGEGCVEGTYSCVDGDVSFTSLGATMKLGGTMGERIWIGAAMDIGVAFFDPEGDDNGFTGLMLFPRFHMDFLLMNVKGFRMVAYGGLGPQIYPIMGSEIVGRDFTAWAVSITMILGASFGG